MRTDFAKAVRFLIPTEPTAEQPYFCCCTQRKHSETCFLYQPPDTTGRISLNSIADCLIEITQTCCFPSSWRLRVRKNDATQKKCSEVFHLEKFHLSLLHRHTDDPTDRRYIHKSQSAWHYNLLSVCTATDKRLFLRTQLRQPTKIQSIEREKLS